MDENNKMKPPPRTLYIRCRQHHLNNRSEVSPKKFQENAISNLYLNTQPRDHEIQVKKKHVCNKQICISSKFKGQIFLSPKGKKTKICNPQKLKENTWNPPSPTSFKGQPLAESNQYLHNSIDETRLWREVTKQHTFSRHVAMRESFPAGIHGTNGIWGFPKNDGTPKSSILIGFSIINHPFWGYPYFWKHPFIPTWMVDFYGKCR